MCQPGDKAALIGEVGERGEVEGQQTNFHALQWDGSEEEQREGPRVVWAHNKEFTKGWKWEGPHCCWLVVERAVGVLDEEFKKRTKKLYFI